MPKKQNKIVGWMNENDIDNAGFFAGKFMMYIYEKRNKDADTPVVILRKADYNALIEIAAHLPDNEHILCDDICKKYYVGGKACVKCLKRKLRSITAKPEGREKKR